MPQFIPVVITAIGTAVGASPLLVGVLSLTGSMLVGSYQQRQAKKKARDQYNAGQVDRLANVVTTIAPMELVLGRARKGGAVYFRGSAGAYKDTFLAHLALAGHEIDGVDQVYLNGVPVTLDADGWVLTEPYYQTKKETRTELINPGSATATLQGNVVAGSVHAFYHEQGAEGGTYVYVPFTLSGNTVTLSEAITSTVVSVSYQTVTGTSYARVWWELGGDNAPADPKTVELFPDLWTSSHRARGCAKLFALFLYNENAFQSSVPAVSAVVRGARVYDPRTGTTVFSENPALLARHVYSHRHFGKATVSAAEDQRFIAAANACDTTYVWPVPGGTDTQPIYRANLVIPFGTPARDALDTLCQAMAGMWAFARGELYIRAGAYTSPVMTLGDADLAATHRDGESAQQSEMSIRPHRERAEKFNVVNLRIWDRAQGYKEVALPPYKISAYIARDGQELSQEMQLPSVWFAQQAQHIAGVMARDARDSVTFEASFKMRAYPLELFDTVSVTLSRYGWSSKTFIILSRVWDRERGVVRLTMKETTAAIYSPSGDFSAAGYAQNTALPKPFSVEPPVLSAENISSGSSQLVQLPDGGYQTRVRVAWPTIADASITTTGEIEVQWAEIGSSEWQTVRVPGDQSQCYLVGPVDGMAIIIRARARNTIAVSDWSTQVAHLVLGKNEPPQAPAAVALTPAYVIFTPSPDIDVKGYRVLYNAGTSTDRSVATQLHTGLIAGSPWPLPVRLYGVNTIIVVAVDAVGNESVPATATQNLGTPDVANVADEVDFVAAGYPGTISNGTVTDGVLLADADASVDVWNTGRGTDLWYLDGADDFWGGTQYMTLTYTAGYRTPYAGGALLLDLEVLGSRTEIDVRIDGSTVGDLWDNARADLWGSDIPSLWGTPGEFRPWNGSIAPTQLVTYEFRVTVDAGSVQGQITTMKVRTEMPQIEQVFGSVAIAAGGTTVSPSAGVPVRDFISIEDVQVTPVGDTAVAGRVKTYPIDPDVGPMVELINSAGVAVDGNAFIRMSGF